MDVNQKRFMSFCYLSPYTFVTEGIGETPRWWQEDALLDIGQRLVQGQKHLKIHARTCHGAGKTKLASWLFLWWMMTRPYSRGVTTAPTWQAVSNLLWREIGSSFEKLQERGLGFGRMLGTQYEIGKNWVGYGISSDEPGRLEGAHSPTAAARFIDEAKTVPEAVVRSTQGLLDAPETFDMAISTPWLNRGWYYELDASARTDMMRIVVDLRQMMAEGVIGSEHAWTEMAQACGGENTAEFKARALAQYIEPEGTFGCVNPAALDDCMAMAPTFDGDVRVGLDVAYSLEGDESVITVMMGDSCVEQVPLRIRDTFLLASRTIERARHWDARSISVDAIGYGAGPVSDLKNWGWGGKVSEFVASAPANDGTRFSNRSTEAAWSLIERVNARGISLPHDPVLRSQFLQVRFVPMANGKVKLDKAPEGSKSPDRFDSLMIACAPLVYAGGAGLLEWMNARKKVAA